MSKPFPLTDPRNSDGASELGRKQRSVVPRLPNDAFSVHMAYLKEIIRLLNKLCAAKRKND